MENKLTIGDVIHGRNFLLNTIKNIDIIEDAELRSTIKKMIDNSEKIEKYYIMSVYNILNEFSEKDENENPVMENNFFVITPEKQIIVMNKIKELESMVIS